MALVNSHLSPAAAGAPDAYWQLTEFGFSELMRALFAGLGNRLHADGAGLRKRYGEQTMETVEAFFRRLNT
jgi:hypothetical protein